MDYQSIVISGLPGAGKGKLAKEISQKYGWRHFSIGEIWREKWTLEHPKKDKSFEEYWREQPIQSQIEVNEKAREVVSQGNVIGDFRYSICCKDIPALFVFVTSSLNVRAKRAMSLDKYKGKSFEEIKAILAQREEDEIKFGKTLYGDNYDYRNEDNYDIIINNDNLSVEEELNIIENRLINNFKTKILP